MSKRAFKNILVTGGAGFIGSAFVRHVLQKQLVTKVVTLDALTYAANLQNLSAVETDKRHVFVRGDILNKALVEELILTHQIEAIVHFAAESHVDRSIQMPHLFYKVNVEGTLSLLEVVRLYPHIYFHHVSTDEVFGSITEGKFYEHSPYRPNSPYAASKAASDHFVRAYHKTYGLFVTLSHSSNNYGPCQYFEKFIPKMIQSCLKKEPLLVYGKGENVRDWLFVEDHVDAIWTIVTEGEKGHSYNVGASQELRNIDLLHLLIEKVAKRMNASPKKYQELIQFTEDRLGHDFRYALDCQKLEQELGWGAKHLFEEGLEATVSWYVDRK